MAIADWLGSNWFEVLEGIGIVSGLFFSSYAVRESKRVNRTHLHHEFVRAHREIWNRLSSQADTKGLSDPSRDLATQPRTDVETQAVRELLLHLRAYFRADREGTLLLPERAADDIREFLSYPLMREAWDELKPYHDREFVEFIDEALRS